MLRADLFTFAALDTVRCLPVIYSMYIVVVKARAPSLEKFLHIHAGEQIRNGNLFWASGRTVSAGGTGNQML